MKVAIRVDASSLIGTGHVMRCLVVAQKLAEQGHDVCLVSRALPDNLISYCQQILNVITLPSLDPMLTTDLHHGAEIQAQLPIEQEHLEQDAVEPETYAHWLGVTQQQDAAQFIEAIAEFKPDWVAVDHYALDDCWERIVQQNGPKIIVIDDLANRKHHCNLLLDHNPWPEFATRYRDVVPKHCQTLLGLKYALLRKNFAQLQHITSPIQNQLLAFFSGSDPSGENIKLLVACQHFSRLPFQVKIVFGLANPRKQALLTETCPDFVTLFENIPNYEHELALSRYALGGAGVSAIERASLRIPSTLVSVADNQRLMAEHLANSGHYRYLGPSDQTTVASYVDELTWLAEHWNSLPQRLAKSDIDGLGAARLVNIMEEIDTKQKQSARNKGQI